MNYFRNLIKKLNKKSNQKHLTSLTFHDIINMKGGKNMENLQVLVQATTKTKFEVSKDKIKQTQRNALKSDLLEALSSDLATSIEVVGRSKEGIIIAIPNDIEGSIYAVVDVVLKNLDFDPQIMLDEYEEAQAEKEAKARAVASKKATAR
jgi:hypothetical protein